MSFGPVFAKLDLIANHVFKRAESALNLQCGLERFDLALQRLIILLQRLDHHLVVSTETALDLIAHQSRVRRRT